jgi:hypothetical protein
MRKFILATVLWLWSGLAYAGVMCPGITPFVPGTLADANQVNANFNTVVACLLNAAVNGVNTDITALTALSAPIGTVAGGSAVYAGGVSGGTANAQTITATTPSGFALTPGLGVVFQVGPGLTNTGTVTLAVSPTAATPVLRPSPSGPQALTGGELTAGNIVYAVYDGTQFQAISVGAQYGGFGPLTSVASAATVDLGTFGSHNVGITLGIVTTITSFGPSASLTYPIYRLGFVAGVTLQNSASLLLPGGGNITTNLNDTAIAAYTGGGNWQVIQYNRANGTPAVSGLNNCGFSGLSLVVTTAANVVWAWRAATLNSATGSISGGAQSSTLNLNSTGANGLDVGTFIGNRFYFTWGIYDPVAAVWGMIGTLSVPPTLPTLPGNYQYACYAGAVRSGTTNLYGTRQNGSEVVYVLGGQLNTTSLPVVFSGNTGSTCSATTPTPQSTTIRGNGGVPSGANQVWVPTTATRVNFQLVSSAAGGQGLAFIAPTSSYTGIATATAPSLYLNGLAGNPVSIVGGLLLEADTVSVCSTTNAVGYMYGWKDSANAN